MKRFVLMALVVGMVATAASATTIGIRFKDFPDDTKVFLDVTDTVEIEVVVMIPAGSGGTLSGFAGVFAPVVDDNLSIISSESKTPDWEDLSIWGVLGSQSEEGPGAPGSVKAAFAAISPSQDSLGEGTFALGNVTIHMDALGAIDNKEIVFDHAFVDLFDAAGAGLSYAPTYGGTYGSYWGYGTYGSPGATGPFSGVDARSPLFIQKVPEPASLAFLVLGGLALVRRRR
jgi:hypothetical protein